MAKRVKKERYITRTIATTVCTVYGINVDTKTMEVHYCEVPGKVSGETAVEACKQKFAADGAMFVPCVVTETTEKETLYRIPESVFLKYAEPVENDTDDTDETDESEG